MLVLNSGFPKNKFFLSFFLVKNLSLLPASLATHAGKFQRDGEKNPVFFFFFPFSQGASSVDTLLRQCAGNPCSTLQILPCFKTTTKQFIGGGGNQYKKVTKQSNKFWKTIP